MRRINSFIVPMVLASIFSFFMKRMIKSNVLIFPFPVQDLKHSKSQ